MTEQENQWRGPLEIEESPRSLEEIQRSWILRPAAERKTSGGFGLQKMLLVAVVVSALLTGVITATFKTVPKHKQKQQQQQQQQDDNYTIALHKALEFFNAQKSGKLPDGNNISWRGDSCLQDGKGFQFGFYKDLVGGYYEAGDAIKFSFPTSYAMTMLSWSVIEYGAKYEAMGELNRVKGLVKWGTDYILKTFDNSSETINTIVSKVGSGNDRYCWLRPEDIKYTRDIFLCSSGCSDIAAEMAAALASASIIFKDEILYSKNLVEGAKKLYEFADSTKGSYSKTKVESKESFHSTTFYDELIWGGTWLYYATGDIRYLAKVTSPVLARRAGAFFNGDAYGVFSWDNKLPGAQVLLTRLRLFLSPGYPYEDILSSFHNQTGVVMCSFLLDFNKFNRTKGGLIELNSGGPKPLQYAANAAFLAALFSDYLEAADTPGWYCGPTFYHTNVLREFAKTQIGYILGDNPQNLSYVVGFGQRYPRHVHHRGASIPKKSGMKESCTRGWKWRDSKKENPNTIVGAMVAGPDRHDGFRDVRADYNYTEPSLAGNAGLVAALAALSREGGGKPPAIDINTMFSAIPPYYPDSPPPPAPWTP